MTHNGKSYIAMVRVLHLTIGVYSVGQPWHEDVQEGITHGEACCKEKDNSDSHD